ncbi:MAG: HisA/HisF-related TIM barrel protein [Thermoplasmata archaeon]|nr:HisA/HisF-related TIM barrel protein [Thermoplasmata archaeon]
MPNRPAGRSNPADAAGQKLVPILMIGKGQVYLPGPTGPVVAKTATGTPLDLLDLADRLAEKFKRVYVVDLDGLRDDKAQLDYLQELSRDLELWVDAGIRTGDQAIDILVAGATRAVLSTAYLRGHREVQRAWKLSQELAFEIEIRGGNVFAADHDWRGMDPTAIATSIRELGVSEVILSPREEPVDWRLTGALAAMGSLWVDGTFERSEEAQLSSSKASGAFFHLDAFLASPLGS